MVFVVDDQVAEVSLLDRQLEDAALDALEFDFDFLIFVFRVLVAFLRIVIVIFRFLSVGPGIASRFDIDRHGSSVDRSRTGELAIFGRTGNCDFGVSRRATQFQSPAGFVPSPFQVDRSLASYDATGNFAIFCQCQIEREGFHFFRNAIVGNGARPCAGQTIVIRFFRFFF